jgi:hypothetical protein
MLKHSASAENEALELNVRRMASRVVPIIGTPGAKTPQVESLVALSDELRAPIERTYRQAALHEERALEALAWHEAQIAFGRNHFQLPANITRPLSRDERPDRSARLPATTRRRSAPQQQIDEDLTFTDELAAEAAEALALQCACVSASLELELTADENRQKRIAQAAGQAIDAEPAPRAVDRYAPAPDIAAIATAADCADHTNNGALLEADRALTLADELAADAAEALALRCACASASLDLALIADMNRQKRIARAAGQANYAEPTPRPDDRHAPMSNIVAKTTLVDRADLTNNVALLEADRALTLTDELAADAAEALALQCACGSASLGLALIADANRQKRIAQVANQAIDAEPTPRPDDRYAPMPNIVAKTTLVDRADHTNNVALLEADRAVTLTDELAADAAEALALQCTCASASLDLALIPDANRQKRIAQVADQAISQEPALRAVDRDAPAPDIAAIATAPDWAGRANGVALLEADLALTLTDELAADAAEALALQCACASASLDLALIADANRQTRITQVADQAIDAEPAEAIRGETAQSAVQFEPTRVGATLSVVLTPHKENSDDGRNQSDAAEQFRRNDSGIAGNERAAPDSNRDDAQDAFFLTERDSGTTRTIGEGPVGATAQRDLGITPRDLDSSQPPLEPDSRRSDGHGDEGEYRNLRNMSTIGGSRRAVSARPNEQATHKEAHLGLQNGSEIPTGFGDHGLQPPSASAGHADQSPEVERLIPTADELMLDKERSPTNLVLGRLLQSPNPTACFDFVAEVNGTTTTKSSASTLPTPPSQQPDSSPISPSMPATTPAPAVAPMRFRTHDPRRRQLTPAELADIRSSSRPRSSSVWRKDETPGTIPVTVRQRFARRPPDKEAPAMPVPAPPVVHPADAPQAATRIHTTMGSTTSAATTRHPAESLAGAKATPAPENRPAHVAQRGLDYVAPGAPATVGASATTGSSAATRSDGEKRAPSIKEGPIIDIGGRSPNYRRLQRRRPGPER